MTCVEQIRSSYAKRWAADTEASIREGRHFKTAEAKKHTLGGLIDRYIRDVLPQKKKSQKKQTAQLLWWKEKIGKLVIWFPYVSLLWLNLKTHLAPLNPNTSLIRQPI